MTKMTSRERMLAAITRQGPDHIPFSTYISQGPFFEPPLRWFNQIERAERLLELGLDPTFDVWLPDPQPHPDVAIKTWREKKADGIFLVKEYHTPAGVLRQRVRETDDWCSPEHGGWIPTTFGIENRNVCGVDLFDDFAVSRRTEPWVKGPEDLPKLRYIIRAPEGYVLDEWRMDAERAVEFARKFNILSVARRTIVGDAFQWFCDIPWFLLQYFDNPGFVREFLAIFHDWSMDLIDLALGVGVDVVQYRGWYEIPNYWGPENYREYLVPIIEAQARRVHQAGKLVSYLLPEGQGVYADILREMSVDSLQGLDPRMLHAGDLSTLFNKLGHGKSFWGGVNAEITLESKDRQVIDAAVRKAVETLGRNGGLILGAFLFRTTPHQSIMYMIDAWRKYCNPR